MASDDDQHEPAQPASTTTPHDSLFRVTLERPEHASGVLRALLPEEVSTRVGWSLLELVPADALRRLSQNETVELRERIVDTALETDLCSISRTVFAVDATMRSPRAVFVGIRSNSCDANANLQAHPGGQL